MGILSLSKRLLKNSARLLRDRLVLERLADSAPGCKIDPRAVIRIGKGCEVRLGRGAMIGAFTFISVEHDRHAKGAFTPFLEIGEYTYIGELNNIRADGGIRIGSKCLISQGVSIISSNHSVKKDVAMYDQANRADRRGVVISDDVWIGTNVTILPGVTIGRGAIIAAGSVVTSSVAEFAIVAGVPARFLKERV